MQKIIQCILSIIASILEIRKNGAKNRKNNKQLKDDKEIADAIKDGNGRKVAEKWKIRKRYSS